MRHRLLNNATTDTHTANQTPITVDLPVLPANRVAQIHAPNQNRLVASAKDPKSPLHAQIRSPDRLNPLIAHTDRDKSTPPFRPQSAQVGLALCEPSGEIGLEQIIRSEERRVGKE